MPEQPLHRVLVVDDDQVIRELVGLLLSRCGYEAEVAESGEAALALLTGEDRIMPSVILTDLQLPGMSGKILATSLRALCGNGTRIAAMSGRQPVPAELDGFDAFLRKPFTEATLDTLLRGDVPLSKHEEEGASQPALNEAVYEQLAGSMSQERLAQLYELCLNDCVRRIQVIREAAVRSEDAICRKQAHAICGSCGMVGAVEIASLGALIESHGLVANLKEALDKMTLACGRLEDILSGRGICIKR